MQKIKTIKKEIDNIVLKPPSTKKMLSELKMYSLEIVQKEGDINFLNLINQDLITKVWQTIKIKNLIEKNKKNTKHNNPLFLALSKQLKNLLAELSSESNKLPEGFFYEGRLEIEVLKNTNKTKN
jgi:hypothetical protein